MEAVLSISAVQAGGYVAKADKVRVQATSAVDIICSSQIRTRARCSPSRCSVGRRGLSVIAGSKQRKAQLSAKRMQIVPLPTFTDNYGLPQPLSQFLKEAEGIQSMLHTKYLEDFEYLGDNIFRCYLPKISVLNRELAPVMDLIVHATEFECVVEMISCKFESSNAFDDKIERFSASLKNHLQWKHRDNGDPLLCTNLSITFSIEVRTLPFALLPLSAVETPGNAVLQAMVDRMVPVFMDHLLEDYHNWVKEKTQDLPITDIAILPILPTSGPESITSLRR